MTNQIDITLAKKLRYLRRKDELKQTDLAEALGYKQQTLSDLENGNMHFTDEIIEKISAYFKITAAEFELPIEQIQISNSPNANSPHSHFNDLKLLEANHLLTLEALKAKDEALMAKDELIKTLKALLENK
jgi:transcriptional regulator with XRE-family HTH domain